MSPQPATQGLTVAITGPTGEIGRAFVRSLERSRSVARVLGMARRPFDPREHGWRKTEYRQGDVLDRAAVDDLVREADVVVHLAFIIVGGLEESRRINLEGSRNVFEAALGAGVQRLVYASSVAAYGFYEDNPQPLTEEVSARGSDALYYSDQKAELEALLARLAEGSKTDVYVLRPSIVAGPDALALIENVPYVSLGERMPDAVRRLLDVVPVLRPVIPDPGTRFQLVHHDDVASALRAATQGKGRPGAYNLAGPGDMTMSDFADAMGWYAVPIPELAADAAAEVLNRLPLMPPQVRWLEAMRVPVLMDCAKARRELDWRPRHDASETLRAMVDAWRAAEEPLGS